ncbi:MAG TPA: carbohydrate porin [Myxococcales bacterium]|nr:carbohydrate porin [Myxococcales bacterium]
MFRRLAASGTYAVAALGGLASAMARADGPAAPLPPPVVASTQGSGEPLHQDWYSLHFQGTASDQAHPSFPAAYSGTNSLDPAAENAFATVLDLFAAVHPWPGAVVCFQPEVSGGLGLSSTLGVADFPSGEVYRVGDPAPAFIVGRAFVQQTFGLGGGRVQVESGPCVVAGPRDRNGLTLTLGRINGPDQFDANPVSNDPHYRFTNWGLWASAAYDYAADTHGYTYGLTAVLDWNEWSARAGWTLEPLYANQMQMDFEFWRSFSLILEGERRWTVHDRPGAVRLLGALNVARMGSYEEAYDDPQYHDDVTATREFGRQKYNVAASANQELARGLSGFVRASWDDGATETWAFTEVDRSLALGVVQTGWRWKRPDDAAGVGFVGSLLSPQHRTYLASGGYGYIIGDGALAHYGPEMVGEIFYEAQLIPSFAVGADYQPIVNPAYNRDRGPVQVFMLRATASF